jgi:mRNA-degrading endonuclease RelE of RelBE toxin-antitoxin system
MFRIELTERALEQLIDLRAHDRSRVLDEIEEQLTMEPTRKTRRRKMIRGIVPPWDQMGPLWQLRIGDYRVFYDVLEEEARVLVHRILRKPPDKTTAAVIEENGE